MPDSLTAICADAAVDLGLSRPAGQCFAVIWQASDAPCADDLAASLGLSRSNVSTALKDLRAWGLIAVRRHAGDRREYFTSPLDPWEVMRLILAGRHRRSLAPMLDRLLAVETDTGDARIAVLQDAASRIGNWLSSLAKLDARTLSMYVDKGPALQAQEERKKKKRKS